MFLYENVLITITIRVVAIAAVRERFGPLPAVNTAATKTVWVHGMVGRHFMIQRFGQIVTLEPLLFLTVGGKRDVGSG